MWDRQNTVEIEGIKYFVSECGASEDAILLLHGLDWTGELWRSLCRLMGPRYRMIAPDLAGHGRSDAPTEIDFPLLSSHMVELVEKVGAKRPVVIASSWAGALALEMASAHPTRLRQVVLLDGGYYPLTAVPGLTWSDFSANHTPDEALTNLRSFLDYMRSDSPELWNADIEVAVSDQVEPDGHNGRLRQRLDAATRVRCLQALWEYDPHSIANRVGVVTEVVIAYSPNEPAEFHQFKRMHAEKFTKSLPLGCLHEMHDTDHLIMMQRPTELSKLLNSILIPESK